MKGRRTKDSDSGSELESDSEEEKPKKTVRHRDSKHKEQNVMTQVKSRKGKVSDSDEEKSTEGLIEEELRKVPCRFKSNPNKNCKLIKSKPKRQEQETLHSFDSDNNGQLEATGGEQSEIKRSQLGEQGKKNSRDESDSDMADEKPFKNSKEEGSARRRKQQGAEKRAETEEKHSVSSDCSSELDVSAERKSVNADRKEHCLSDSDMDSNELTKVNSTANVRTADAAKGTTGKYIAENATDSSDIDEDKTKNRSSNIMSSSMSSSESEDSSTRNKTKKETSKKTSAVKRENRPDSISGSSASDDERSKKDKKKDGKNPVS
jgi:hypothetical protein